MSRTHACALLLLFAALTSSAHAEAQPAVVAHSAAPPPSAPTRSADETDQTPSHTRFVQGMTLLFGYGYVRREFAGERQRHHRFDLDRAQVWLAASRGSLDARVLLEAVRSADEGALIGVAGDSVLMRVREAWFGYHPLPHLSLRAGVVPTLFTPAFERQDGLRDIGRTPLEELRLQSPADVGVVAGYTLARELASLTVGAFSGEGYTGQELNATQAIEVLLSVSAGGANAPTHPLRLTLAARSGRRGAAAIRDDRLHVALAWVTPELASGFAFSYLLGLQGDSARRGSLIQAFARVRLAHRLLLGVRFWRFMRDLRHADDHWMRLQGAVGVDVVAGLRLWLVAQRSWPGSRTRDLVPGSDELTLRGLLAATL